MSSKKTLLYLSAAAAVLIIFAFIGKKAGWLGQEITYEVAVEKVKLRTITEIITANGKIQPETEVMITPDVSGEIVEIVVKEGDNVKPNQYLLKIKPDNYISLRDRALASLNTAKSNLSSSRARLAQVEARFQQAKLTYARMEKLWDERAISESEWEAAQSEYEVARTEVTASHENVAAAEYSVQSAQAGLNEANENLMRTSIYSPMEGTIIRLNVEKGERVVGTELMSGTEIMRVANLERMEILAEVNENDIVRLQLGDSAIIEVDAFPDRKFTGTVTEIANSAISTGISTDQVTNFEVKILITKSSYADLVTDQNTQPLRPGMSASVDIITDLKESVISIPLQAVTLMADSLKNEDALAEGKNEDDPVEIVFVFERGKARTVKVETGIQDNNYIEIRNGLAIEQEVIFAPYNVISKNLKDGTPVKAVPEEKLTTL